MTTQTCENCYGGYDPDDEGEAGVCGQCAWDEDAEEPTDRSGCDMEMCPMWDGHSCPCATFGLDKDNLPTSGIYSVEIPAAALRSTEKGSTDV